MEFFREIGEIGQTSKIMNRQLYQIKENKAKFKELHRKVLKIKEKTTRTS